MATGRGSALVEPYTLYRLLWLSSGEKPSPLWRSSNGVQRVVDLFEVCGCGRHEAYSIQELITQLGIWTLCLSAELDSEIPVSCIVASTSVQHQTRTKHWLEPANTEQGAYDIQTALDQQSRSDVSWPWDWYPGTKAGTLTEASVRRSGSEYAAAGGTDQVCRSQAPSHPLAATRSHGVTYSYPSDNISPYPIHPARFRRCLVDSSIIQLDAVIDITPTRPRPSHTERRLFATSDTSPREYDTPSRIE